MTINCSRSWKLGLQVRLTIGQGQKFPVLVNPDSVLCMCCSIPSLLPTIQERLLDSISFVLSKAPYPPSRLSSTGSIRAGTVVNASQSSSDVNSAELVQLALHTLAHFNFKVIFLFPYLFQQSIAGWTNVIYLT